MSKSFALSVSLCINLLISCHTIPAASQSVTLTLTPDTPSPTTSESLDNAREILQKRLDTLLKDKTRLFVNDGKLKLELSSKEYIRLATRLATETGAIIFFLSDTSMDVGSAIPDNISPVITDRDVTEAKPTPAMGNSWSIRITVSDEGAGRLRQHTRDSIGRYMIIAKDGAVVSAPVIRLEIGGNEVEISGADDLDFARLLVAQLHSGRLPFRFKVVADR